MEKLIEGEYFLEKFSGKAQVYFKKDALPEAVFSLVKRDLHVGDYLAVVQSS